MTLVSKRTRPGEDASSAMSVLDSATGLYNRRYFAQRFDEEISRACRNGDKLSLMFLVVELPEEMDKYVRIIRLDDYLYDLGQALKSYLRKIDVIARFGETSFAIIMPHTSENADRVGHRLIGGSSTRSRSARAARTSRSSPARATAYRDIRRMLSPRATCSIRPRRLWK